MDRLKEYYLMLDKYKEYEVEYWAWADERKEFNRCCENRVYYRKNGSQTREKFAIKCVSDFPLMVMRDLHSQVGGCRSIIIDLKLVPEHDYYWNSDGIKWTLFSELKRDPSVIYDMIEETYRYSIKVRIRTSLIPNKVVEIIEDIAFKNVW